MPIRNAASPGIHAEAGATCVFLSSSSGSDNILVGKKEAALDQLLNFGPQWSSDSGSLRLNMRKTG